MTDLVAAEYAVDAADEAHDAALQTFRDAQRALKRSKSMANRLAYVEAAERCEQLATRCLEARAAAEQVAEQVLADYRAATGAEENARQGNLF